MSAEDNLKKLGLTLPTIPTPVANYVPWKRDGNTIYLSGQGPRDKDGKHITGLVGKDVTVEQAYEHAKLVGTLQRVAATENPIGSLREMNRSGWSVFLEPRQGVAGLAGIFRYDAFDPDHLLATNEQNRVIAGGAYWFVWPRSRLGLVATNEQVHYDSPLRPDENRLLFQTHIEF